MNLPTARKARIDWRGRPVDIEYAWVGAEAQAATLADAQANDSSSTTPLLVFLHEGLGSLSMWKDFPAQLVDALGARGLVYSRPAYGASTPRAADEHWAPDFLHQQALEVLPALLRTLGVTRAPWLFGHSDGASIALLAAAHRPFDVAGAILLAPHIMVEDLTVTSIEAARDAYREGGLRSRLARYHADVDSAFWGWCDIWLDPRFRQWTIADEIVTIRCPLLAIQGLDDRYGTLEQVHGITRRVGTTRLLELPDCGHSPHIDQPAAVFSASRTFLDDTRRYA